MTRYSTDLFSGRASGDDYLDNDMKIVERRTGSPGKFSRPEEQAGLNISRHLFPVNQNGRQETKLSNIVFIMRTV